MRMERKKEGWCFTKNTFYRNIQIRLASACYNATESICKHLLA